MFHLASPGNQVPHVQGYGIIFFIAYKSQHLGFGWHPLLLKLALTKLSKYPKLVFIDLVLIIKATCVYLQSIPSFFKEKIEIIYSSSVAKHNANLVFLVQYQHQG